MIKICGTEHLSQCAEIAFKRNSLPGTSCAFCSSSKESICKDFEFMINNAKCLVLGYFAGDSLLSVFGFFMNPENNWVDCVGPFFKDEWNPHAAKDMFLFAQSTLTDAARFNFFFDARNVNCHQLMEELAAERGDNEYILLLDKADYKPQEVKNCVVRYTDEYENDLIQLHDMTFPDVYVTGTDIISSIGSTREAFCALDDNGDFAGYGILKLADDSKQFTAEIFAVKDEMRRKGYGWALLNAVIDSAFNKHNADIVSLVVEKLNTHARDLYFSCGFKLSVENEMFYLRAQ